MKRISPVTAACCALPAIILYWYLFTSVDAKWLHVETLPFAVRGENFKVQVTLTSPEPGLYLGADIHGMDEKKKSTGYLSGGRQIQVTADTKVYEFYIPVPLNTNASFIFPVIILSRDGTWGGRISAADTAVVPVHLSGGRTQIIKPEFKRAHDTARQAPDASPESRTMSTAISFIWLAAAITAAFSRKLFTSSWIATAAAVSSAWEVLNSSMATGNILRMAALGSGLYSGRRMPQQLLTAGIILMLVIAAVYLFSSGLEIYRILLWICITAYCGINILQVLSLHETDMLLSVNISGVQAGQLLKLTAAVVCLAVCVIIRKNLSKEL